jgi:hypothetical protein
MSPGYDPSINLEDELKELDRGRERMTAQYSRVPKGKGEILARIAGPLGIGAAVIGLFFIGSILAANVVEGLSIIAFIACFTVPLGALLSLGAITLAIIALALGAGVYRSKAVFAIIFAALFWVMLAATWILSLFLFTIDASSAG